MWWMEGVCTMWLSELGTFAMFWGLEIPSITETDILWCDLREYMCYFQCSASMFSPLVLWPCLPCIMNYQLCMTHDLATVNHHDCAWTEKWALDICKLSVPMSLARLPSSPREHLQRGRLYTTKVKWKNCLACFPLLGMGLMIVLRRASW